MKGKGNIKLPDLTTLEVIDQGGKVFFITNPDKHIELVVTDQGTKLQVYIKDRK
jgi:hypothetical protein